ncbi:hypothetical protein [Streptomyces sp. URMC 129]|uniref:hypothetical protein n=1 Tax=Streptomyces sp. URMC 129 TaxID=3423407 RepID=UPI003F1DF472
MTSPTAQRAARDLRTIREHWGDLLVAIETRPAAEWPPRETASFLDILAAADEAAGVVEDRLPYILRPHPAPLNVDALDAAVAAERMLFALADTLSSAVDRAPQGDPRRWEIGGECYAGSRARPGSLHFAATYCEGRVLGEDTEPEYVAGRLHAAPFLPLPEHLVREAADVARRAALRVLGAVGISSRPAEMPRPCPYCGGVLLLHRSAGGPPAVTCQTGAACSAPVPLDGRGRRRWGWPAVLEFARDGAPQTA